MQPVPAARGRRSTPNTLGKNRANGARFAARQAPCQPEPGPPRPAPARLPWSRAPPGANLLNSALDRRRQSPPGRRPVARQATAEPKHPAENRPLQRTGDRPGLRCLAVADTAIRLSGAHAAGQPACRAVQLPPRLSRHPEPGAPRSLEQRGVQTGRRGGRALSRTRRGGEGTPGRGGRPPWPPPPSPADPLFAGAKPGGAQAGRRISRCSRPGRADAERFSTRCPPSTHAATGCCA